MNGKNGKTVLYHVEEVANWELENVIVRSQSLEERIVATMDQRQGMLKYVTTFHVQVRVTPKGILDLTSIEL